ncbi:hypothetical protein N6H18_13105 [Reichenbachiella agarivorans]|uniref:Uncharacterized protein n=1 Tax=Reichenbachiella agarivorans TaxID=2979464 RepID=A0ABY6CPJ5_9BACT|nr:hypothetical protein [Reichenbachiella agarivorans]UXP31288.1 hypothetical protein N6H18_13105 [Reichenbachiella agarivorans]
MDDSNILYYIVLGAIYLLSRFLKKKKPEDVAQESTEDTQQPTPSSRPKDQPSFEDLFKQITGESYVPVKERSAQERNVIERQVEARQAVVEAERHVKEQTVLSEVVKPVSKPRTFQDRAVAQPQKHFAKPKTFEERTDRDKPIVFARSEKFAIQQEDDEFREDLLDMLAEEDGAKKAFVLGEIFDRKY